MENKGEEKNRGRMKSRKNILIFAGLLIGVLLVVLVLAASPAWNESAYNVSHYFNEDSVVYYNFTKNVTDLSELSYFSILDISWSENNSLTDHSDFSWLPWNDTSFSNSSTGVLKINSTLDNETGNYTLNMLVQGTNGGSTNYFEFIINATNDAPNFTSAVNDSYNFSVNANHQNKNITLYGEDEEEHYPLDFNYTIYNCSVASWSSRYNASGNDNCTLSSVNSSLSDTSYNISFTSLTNDDAGIYYLKACVMDNATANASKIPAYPSPTYNDTKFVCKNITLNFQTSLTVNISNCSGMVFQENQTGTCNITIRTKGEQDELNISSKALLRNYPQGQIYVSNESWFFSNQSNSSENFLKTITINVTPQKQEVGNWTINFTVDDLTSNKNVTEQIYVYVNRTIASSPSLDEIPNQTSANSLAVYENRTIYVNASDNDLLIPDKDYYNETFTFSLNPSWVSISVDETPSGKNYTTAKIEIDWDSINNSDGAGNYTINISVTDIADNLAERNFTIEILGDTAPEWNDTNYTFVIYENNDTFIIYENGINLNNNTFINLSEYVEDIDPGDTINFSFTNDTAFPSFNLNSITGIIDFIPIDEDVGYHNITVNASDGKLNSFKSFNFTILNVNDNPSIISLETSGVTNASVDANSNINAVEDNLTTIILWIQDNDVSIPSGQKSYYNESFTLDVNITGINSSLFSFSFNRLYPGFTNITEYKAVFTPKKADIGAYNITINVTDASNSSTSLEFNITISAIEHSPVLMNLTNQISAVNRSFYYRINATDVEDGNSSVSLGNSNFTFSYEFVSGVSFLNSTNFNTTTGEINITFNSSQGGKYHINITVNDSADNQDLESFRIDVYDPPVISYPSSLEIFNLTENEIYNFNFTVNHSIEDNLTYLFYIDLITYNGSEFNYSDLILRENVNYYGNGTNLTWQFTPNFTDESYGKLKNLSLIVYPSNSNLINAALINSTLNIKLNISHTNYPINFSGTIANQSKEKTKKIYIDLEDYFSSLDYDDAYYNRTVNFTILNSDTNLSPSGITSNFPYSNWTLSLASSSGVALEEDLFINSTEFDSNNNLLSSKYSNSFNTEFTEPSQTTTPPVGGGGGGSSIPVSFKIIHPGEIFVSQYEKVDIPLKLENKGSKAFQRINLVNTLLFNSTNSNQGIGSFDIDYFDFLKVGETKNFSLSLLFNTAILGEYEVMVNASSLTPRYNDGIKIKVHVQELNKSKVEEILIFTEEFITQNPECAEITEIVNEAKKHFEEGDLINAKLKAEEAVNACKDAISQVSIPKERKTKEQLLKDYLNYLILISFFAFIVGIVYYFIKRRAFIKKYKE